MEGELARAEAPVGAGAGAPPVRRSGPLPLRPRGGFGGYLHELRRERGLTVRQLAADAGVHHTYVSKLERGDRQAPDEPVVEALARAMQATPAQLDQLRWRAGLAPRGSGAPGQDDPTLTMVAEALGDGALTTTDRDRLRQAIAQVVQRPDGAPDAPAAGAPQTPAASGAPPYVPPAPSPPQAPSPPYTSVAPQMGPPGAAPSPASLAYPPPAPSPPQAPPLTAPPAPAPDGRATLLSGLLGGWQTLDEAAAELRVTGAYLWDLIQGGYLRAWALPGQPALSPAAVRLRREDVLALLQPVTPLVAVVPGVPGAPGVPPQR